MHVAAQVRTLWSFLSVPTGCVCEPSVNTCNTCFPPLLSGVAGLLTLLLHHQLPTKGLGHLDLKCYAYEPPAVADVHLAQSDAALGAWPPLPVHTWAGS